MKKYRDVYETLEINPSASIKEIKVAYAKKIKEFHPEEFPEEFMEINSAYEEAISRKRFEFEYPQNNLKKINLKKSVEYVKKVDVIEYIAIKCKESNNLEDLYSLEDIIFTIKELSIYKKEEIVKLEKLEYTKLLYIYKFIYEMEFSIELEALVKIFNQKMFIDAFKSDSDFFDLVTSYLYTNREYISTEGREFINLHINSVKPNVKNFIGVYKTDSKIRGEFEYDKFYKHYRPYKYIYSVFLYIFFILLLKYYF